MNQKPYNKSLINLVCLVCTGKYLPSFFFAQTSLAPSSLGLYEKPQANTLPYRAGCTNNATFVKLAEEL